VGPPKAALPPATAYLHRPEDRSRSELVLALNPIHLGLILVDTYRARRRDLKSLGLSSPSELPREFTEQATQVEVRRSDARSEAPRNPWGGSLVNGL
jgi:hypothetical protein